MRLLDVVDAGTRYEYRWPEDVERYPHWLDYSATAPDGDHRLRIGFCTRQVYGRQRKRVVIWIDGRPEAEFLGADDYERSGALLSELRVAGDPGERMCRYPDEPIPERYAAFTVVGLPTRVAAAGVHNAWAVLANVSDHQALAALAGLRRIERRR